MEKNFGFAAARTLIGTVCTALEPVFGALISGGANEALSALEGRAPSLASELTAVLEALTRELASVESNDDQRAALET